MEHIELVEPENENENAVEESVVNDDDRKSYLVAVLNNCFDFVKTLHSSMIGGKYA